DLIEKRKQLPEQQVLECGIQVARGLRAAHQQGLIHRDVKPANILFADEHTAKISDFGLAGVAGEGSEAGAEIWGTPYYVAPDRVQRFSSYNELISQLERAQRALKGIDNVGGIRGRWRRWFARLRNQ